LKATLSARLILWVGVPAVLLFTVVIAIAADRSFQRVAAETKARAQATARHHAAEMEKVLRHVEKIPHMIGLDMELGALMTPEAVELYLRRVVETNPEIYGSAIAFKPFGFDPEVRDYGPYWYRNGEKMEFVQLGNADYNYPRWDWYRRPRDLGQAIWTEPFFDEGGGNVVMITRAVPFRRTDQFWGIATIDMPVSRLATAVNEIVMEKSGYGFLVSRKGAFITHPDPKWIMNHMVSEVNPELAGHLMSGADGWLLTREPVKNREAWIAYSPILDGALSLAVVFPKDEVMAEAYKLLYELIGLGAAGTAALFLSIVIVARSLSRPIQTLSRAARAVSAGNLDVSIESSEQTLEVQELAESFRRMTRDLRTRIRELRYTTTVKERLEGELSAARGIQMSLLPKIFPAFPDRKEFDVHAVVRPAREVGGDFYDFFLIDPRTLCVLISDVSGKGVPAALFMAVSKSLIKATAFGEPALNHMVAKVNDELCEEADAGMFVTLLIALLDTETGRVELCNAGHLPPYLVKGDGTVTLLKGPRAPALALASGLTFATEIRQLEPGDALFFFTDGVTEALNPERKFYTVEKLAESLPRFASLPLEKMTRGIVQEVRTFSEESEQADDISVLALRWLGAEEPNAVTHDTSQLPCATPEPNLEPHHGR
jgi:phosphoserine phosphatase RsbU/P